MKFWHKEKFGIILTLVSSTLLLILISTIALFLVNSSSEEKKQKIEKQLVKDYKKEKEKELQNNYQAVVKDLLGQLENNSSVEKSFSQIEEFLFDQDVPRSRLNQHLSAAVEFRKIKQKYSSGAINENEAISQTQDLLKSIIE